jgi:MFS family permease
LLALLGNLLTGALSDRTTSRFGRRRPWILGGALASALALIIMMTAQSVLVLSIGWCTFQLTSNLILSALAAVIPDQIPEQQRGTAAGIVGLSVTIGAVFGSIVIGLIIKAIMPSYILMLVLLLVATIPYALFLRDKALPKEAVQPFHLGAFLKNFWIDPRKYPDFSWTWITRFIPIFGYALGTGYLFYYLEDAIHYTRLFPGQGVEQGVSIINLLGTLVASVATIIGGILSDRAQRRKIFIILANILIALALFTQALVPPWIVLLISVGVLGAGFGMYFAVDAAVVTLVLPSAQNRAKDMGIFNIANTLPQSLGPAIAALIITTTHSYSVLFAIGTVVVLLGTLAVFPIRAVR